MCLCVQQTKQRRCDRSSDRAMDETMFSNIQHATTNNTHTRDVSTEMLCLPGSVYYTARKLTLLLLKRHVVKKILKGPRDPATCHLTALQCGFYFKMQKSAVWIEAGAATISATLAATSSAFNNFNSSQSHSHIIANCHFT